MMTAREKIAQRIRERREAKGLSQSELARRIGLERQQVAVWEKARNKPSEENFLALARILGTSISYLFGETDDPRPAPDWYGGAGPGSALEASTQRARELLQAALKELDGGKD